MTVILTLAVLCQVLVAAVNGISVTECGKTLGCYRSPEGCTESTCEYLATWKNIANDKIAFELLTRGKYNNYITIGFSKDQRMGDDSVIDCVYESAGNPIKVEMSHNAGKSNAVLNPNNKLGLSDTSGSKANDVFTCGFTRQITVAAEAKIFDLKDSYYLSMARGSVASGSKKMHSLSPLPEVSSEKIDFKIVKDYGGGKKPRYPLVVSHGVMMLLAWFLTSTVGMMMPKYYKPVLKTQIMGKDAWFRVHQTLMALTALFTIIGFILIFVHVRGYTQSYNRMSKSHPILGFAVTGLCLANVISGIFRPAPNHPRRPWFGVLHSLFGSGASTIAIMNCVFGVIMSNKGVLGMGFWASIAFCVWYVALYIAIAAASRLLKDQESQPAIEMNTDHGSSPKQNEGTCMGLTTFKKGWLPIFTLGNIIILIVTIAGVVMG